MDLYDRLINKFKCFCDKIGTDFPPSSPSVVAAFLCDITDSSDRPRSQLASVSASLGCLYDGLGLPNIMADADIRKLVVALVKSGTSQPRQRSAVLPIQPFHDLFLRWPDNELLSIKDLRLKCITLLAFVTMLRPSDIAPRAQVFHPILDTVENVTFNVSQLDFHDDGSLSIMFHGIKNDYLRDGYSIHVPASSQVKLDPVRALRVYVAKTAEHRAGQGPVFLTLARPFKALSSSSISKVLQSAISLAGLPASYTAKCFRPSGATYAIESGLNPDSVRKIGRWKSQPVFEEHYVHAKPCSSFTDKVLNV